MSIGKRENLVGTPVDGPAFAFQVGAMARTPRSKASRTRPVERALHFPAADARGLKVGEISRTVGVHATAGPHTTPADVTKSPAPHPGHPVSPVSRQGPGLQQLGMLQSATARGQSNDQTAADA
jgi:hypothetical protein